jgi:uncharacterized phage-associated protein
MTIPAIIAAKKICMLGNWRVTNLKLQKILYLAHMVYLGRNNGEPLIDELFEAWDYGPVLPSLYKRIKIFSSEPIPSNIFDDLPVISKSSEADIIEEACRHYLPKRAGELVTITHRDNGAWAKNYDPPYCNNQIPNEDILAEYRSRVSGSEV